MENAIHRAVLVSSETQINAEDIMITSQPNNDNGVAGGLIGRTIDSVEKDLIMGTLDHCLGNRTHAANILGISIRTLRNKLNEYNVA
jgi:DNA-binding NtrC family response regulator